MSGAWAIARRETASFLATPIGWIVIALYLAVSGAVFAFGSLSPGEPASMEGFFALSRWLIMFIAPAISMRLLAEEFHSGSIEPLMTAPVSDWEVAIGKYVGAVGFMLLMLAPTLTFAVALFTLASPDPGPILAGYIGLILLGMLYLSIGLLASAVTSSQIVAFLGTMFFLLLVRLGALKGAEFVSEPYDRALYALLVDLRMLDFARGVIDTAHVVFFVAASMWFVALTALSLEIRRWR